MSRTARALFDCSGDNNEELSFNVGDVFIEVCDSSEPGWLLGTLERSKQRGLFPANYVEMLEEKTAAPVPLKRRPPPSTPSVAPDAINLKQERKAPPPRPSGNSERHGTRQVPSIPVRLQISAPHFIHPSDFERMVNIFHAEDSDHDGYWSADQTKAFFYLSRIQNHHLRNVWDIAERDGDCYLSIYEFVLAFLLVGRHCSDYDPIPSDPSVIPTDWIDWVDQHTSSRKRKPGELKPSNWLKFRPPLVALKPASTASLTSEPRVVSKSSSSAALSTVGLGESVANQQSSTIPQKTSSSSETNPFKQGLSSNGNTPPVAPRPSMHKSGSNSLLQKPKPEGTSPAVAPRQPPQLKPKSDDVIVHTNKQSEKPSTTEVYAFVSSKQTQELLASENGKKAVSTAWDNKDQIYAVSQTPQGQMALKAGWEHRDTLVKAGSKMV